MTYVPAEKSWITVTDVYDGISISSEQMHAWHPESYLLGSSPRSVGGSLLTGVSRHLEPIIQSISNGIGRSGLG